MLILATVLLCFIFFQEALFSRSLPSRSGGYLSNNKGNFEAGGINWKKYAIGGDGGQGQRPPGLQSAIAAVRKSSQAKVTDLRSRSGTAVAIDDPNAAEGGGKVDSETNTDRGVIMIRRNQQGQAFPFTVRRPSAPAAGDRLSNYRGMIFPSRQVNGNMGNVKSMGAGGGIYMNVSNGQSDMGPEAYNAGTLERKKKGLTGQITPVTPPTSSSTSTQGIHHDFTSNSLGRRRTGGENIKDKLFGSRSSLNKMNSAAANGGGGSGENNNGFNNSTIISNPHATFSKLQKQNGNSLEDSALDTSPTGSTGSSSRNPYVSVYMTSSDHVPQRPLSAMSSPVSTPGWMKGGGGANMVANGMRGAYSETESMENIHASIQSQIQQAKALAQASRQILAQNQQCLQRSDSFKSTRSERSYPSNSQQPSTLPRTGSYTQLSPTSNGATSPCHSARSSGSAFAYPVSGVGYKGTSPYTTLMIQSKLSSSKDDDCKCVSSSLIQ